jgi:hypothetical protein
MTPEPLMTLHRFRFTTAPSSSDVVRTFRDPSPCDAIAEQRTAFTLDQELDDTADMDLLVVAGTLADAFRQNDGYMHWVQAAPGPTTVAPVVIMMNGAQIYWGQQRTVLVAPTERVATYFAVLLDFGYHERSLRLLEQALTNAWSALDADTPLAHRINSPDPDRFEEVAERTETALRQRMQLARLEPHFYGPQPHLQPLANQLLERLRERARIDDRVEILYGQFEVVVETYEMASQRISDYKHARRSHALEWGIIVLLFAEVVLLLFDLLWTMEKG